MASKSFINFLLKVDYNENKSLDNVKECVVEEDCRYMGIYKLRNKMHIYLQFSEPVPEKKICRDFNQFGEINKVYGFFVIEKEDELIEESGLLVYKGPTVKVRWVEKEPGVNNFTVDINNIHKKYVTKELIDMLKTAVPDAITKRVLKDLETVKRCNKCNLRVEDGHPDCK